MSLVVSGVGLEESASECATQGLAFSRIEDPLLAAASACGDKTVLIDGDEVLSYAALGEAVRDFAAGLQARGLAPGDRVSVFLDKMPQCVIALYGAWLAGSIVVPVNKGLRARQVYHILANSGSCFLVTDPRKVADLDSGNLGSSTEVLEAADVGQPAGGDLHPSVAGQDERAAILYTSGSTGLPKGILISHANLLAGSRIVARYLELKRGGAPPNPN